MCKKTLRQIRREKDITQEELAKITGITDRSISLYENDIEALKSASYKTIEKLAIALDVKISDIYLD